MTDLSGQSPSGPGSHASHEASSESSPKVSPIASGQSAPRVFVVMGQTGEYSDRSDWSVIGYTSEAVAGKHVEAAEAYAREHGVLQEFRIASPGWDDRCEIEDGNPYDPGMMIDYTGTRYYVESLVLSDASEPVVLGGRNAQGIEAQGAETSSGSVNESPVTEGHAP